MPEYLLACFLIVKFDIKNSTKCVNELFRYHEQNVHRSRDATKQNTRSSSSQPANLEKLPRCFIPLATVSFAQNSSQLFSFSRQSAFKMAETESDSSQEENQRQDLALSLMTNLSTGEDLMSGPSREEFRNDSLDDSLRSLAHENNIMYQRLMEESSKKLGQTKGDLIPPPTRNRVGSLQQLSLGCGLFDLSARKVRSKVTFPSQPVTDQIPASQYEHFDEIKAQWLSPEDYTRIQGDIQETVRLISQGQQIAEPALCERGLESHFSDSKSSLSAREEVINEVLNAQVDLWSEYETDLGELLAEKYATRSAEHALHSRKIGLEDWKAIQE